MSFEPVTDISQVRVIHAEDSEFQREECALTVLHLLGVPEENFHQFTQIDKAASFIEQDGDKTTPTIVLLDNQTPGEWKGIDLAKSLLERKEEFPNLIIVTITSSDVAIAFDNDGIRLKELREKGGEFWSKFQEEHLCILWLGECLKKGEIIPREQWLEKLGIQTKFIATDLPDVRTPEDWEIYKVVDKLRYISESDTPKDILNKKGFEVGDFFNLEAPEVLAKLGFPDRGIEGQQPSAIES